MGLLGPTSWAFLAIAAPTLLACWYIWQLLCDWRRRRTARHDDQAIALANAGHQQREAVLRGRLHGADDIDTRPSQLVASGIKETVRTWKCECIVAWDGQGNITGRKSCAGHELLRYLDATTDWEAAP